MNNFIENIISGVVGGIVVYSIQLIRENKKEKRLNLENNKVGKKDSKYIDSKFLYNYQPGGLVIEKVIQDFGQPISRYEYPVNSEFDLFIMIYEYKFINAVVLFSTEIDKSLVVSITLNATKNDLHPVICPYTFDKNKMYFGEAKITSEIIENTKNFESQAYYNWGYSALKTEYFMREIKHLTFTYIVCLLYIEKLEEMKDKIIDQICISTDIDVSPVINFYDMVY